MLRDRRFLWAIVGTLVVLVLCLIPGSWLGNEQIPKFTYADKVVHFGMFLVFAALWTWAGEPAHRRTRFVLAAKVVVVVVALAVGTEWLQGMPAIRRDPDVFDALADTAGGAVGVALVLALCSASAPARPATQT